MFLIVSLAGFGRKDVVEHLLENGANVHARDDGGLIPLHNACSFGHAEVVQLLLRHGADPNSRDNWNYTPLHEAAIKGKIDVCIGQLKKKIQFVPCSNWQSFVNVIVCQAGNKASMWAGDCEKGLCVGLSYFVCSHQF